MQYAHMHAKCVAGYELRLDGGNVPRFTKKSASEGGANLLFDPCTVLLPSNKLTRVRVHPQPKRERERQQMREREGERERIRNN
jgi:hypothetical protein